MAGYGNDGPRGGLETQPLEVQLVADVTGCRACNWFWAKPPYGPYPAFDFGADFPSEVPARQAMAPPRGGEAVRWLEGTAAADFVNPQILHGCRKAPIMTIGINPNLTAFWPGRSGARWAYPRFSTWARYAYHYRYRTLYQESLAPEFIRAHVDPADAVRAEGAGWLKEVDFAWARRQWKITVAYDDPAHGEKTYTVTWDETRSFVLLYDRPSEPPSAPQFQAGEIIGGFQSVPAGAQTTVFSNTVGYYARFVPILEMLASHLKAQHARPSLAMAEDVCQLDMVACASPGWSGKYEIDKGEVVGNCVRDRAWAIKQLVQSNPRIIVFSGRSAYEMFEQALPGRVAPALDMDDPETYYLLAATCRWPHYLDIDETVDGHRFRLRARVVIAPHFSYDDNFLPHARFSPARWAEFRAAEPEAVAALGVEERILEPSRDGYVPVETRELGDFGERFPRAVAYLLRNFYEPIQMIASALVQEAVMGNLPYDEGRRHLARSLGPCRFCVNDGWEFPEGCGYGKPEEEALPDGYLEAVARRILASE